ncbi:hypothetical protein [Azospirillum sp.]|uniref:hypothetical protein n=1 Tax=Azospirillum sp. TaxID=34012 RepID=UPI002D4B93B8|nr:hypothetical protein [Azospirillum sp.]HYD70866.1 hypothetical protein [Azospirillum sp.]
MIDSELLGRYRAVFGDTFNVALWAMRPGDAVNGMMRAALSGTAGPPSDDLIAAELAERVGTPANDA